MDIEGVRAQLRETQESLRRNEEEREILLALVKGFEGWLRLYGFEKATTLPLPANVGG